MLDVHNYDRLWGKSTDNELLTFIEFLRSKFAGCLVVNGVNNDT